MAYVASPKGLGGCMGLRNGLAILQGQLVALLLCEKRVQLRRCHVASVGNEVKGF